MLRIAIAKGRLMDSLINYLDVIEYTTLSETLKIENANLLSVDNIECILVEYAFWSMSFCGCSET